MTYFGRKTQVKKQKSNLDEWQEQTLLRIERNGCWLAFWALLASLFIQQAVFGMGELKAVAGEWIIFMLLAAYLAAACMQNGIWDRRLKADPKTNLLVSLATAIFFAAVFAVVGYCNYRSLPGAAATFAVLFWGCLWCCSGRCPCPPRCTKNGPTPWRKPAATGRRSRTDPRQTKQQAAACPPGTDDGLFLRAKRRRAMPAALKNRVFYFCSRSSTKAICSRMPRGMHRSSTSNCWLCRAAVTPCSLLPQPRW